MKTYTPDSLLVASRQELIDIILEQSLLIDKLTNAITEHAVQLEWLKNQVFGQKSERFVNSSDIQCALDLGVITSQDASGNNEPAAVNYERKTASVKEPVKGHGRGAMPAHLPVQQTVIEPEELSSDMIKIGEEVSWYYEMDKPASLHIVQIIRPKYALPDKSGVVIGELPKLPVEKGNAGPGLLAHITSEKYLYHMPLDRQRKKFKQDYDVDFSDSWLSDNVGRAVFWYKAAYDAYKKELLASSYLQADETPIPVLTKDNKGKTHRGYLWVYHDPVRKITIFDYQKNRSGDGPLGFLADFKGVLQIDGYEGYNAVIAQNGLQRAACMDHVRRRFDQALSYDKERAVYALDCMREWYEVERETREHNLSADERLSMRKEKVAAPMAAFKAWMQRELAAVLPKSPTGIALQYALNQWGYFDPYLADGRVELSNILIENAIRPVALGRKNFLFAGSHDAAAWPAVIYSLTAIAKNHGVNPFEYFKELLTNLPKATSKDIGNFLLPVWKPRSSEV